MKCILTTHHHRVNVHWANLSLEIRYTVLMYAAERVAQIMRNRIAAAQRQGQMGPHQLECLGREQHIAEEILTSMHMLDHERHEADEPWFEEGMLNRVEFVGVKFTHPFFFYRPKAESSKVSFIFPSCPSEIKQRCAVHRV